MADFSFISGRGGNAWLSPDGCLSFSFPLHFELDSNLGQRLPFVQHIAALAVVEAVRGMRGYEVKKLILKYSSASLGCLPCVPINQQNSYMSICRISVCK